MKKKHALNAKIQLNSSHFVKIFDVKNTWKFSQPKAFKCHPLVLYICAPKLEVSIEFCALKVGNKPK
jgi:hypothetical protein